MGIIGTEVLIPRHNKRWKIPFPIQLKSVFYAKNRRKHSATGIYHVMLRGINRQDIFEEPEDYWEFIRILFLLYNTFFLKDGGTPKVACLFFFDFDCYF